MNITNIISVILLSVYSLANFSGIGIYNCNCTHSKRLVLMAVQPSCQCSTSAESCCSHHLDEHSDEHSEEVHDHDDCCFLVKQQIEIDQLTVSEYYDFQVKVLSLFFSPFVLMNDFAAGFNECFAVFKNHSPPTRLKIPLIYLQGQLRL